MSWVHPSGASGDAQTRTIDFSTERFLAGASVTNSVVPERTRFGGVFVNEQRRGLAQRLRVLFGGGTDRDTDRVSRCTSRSKRCGFVVRT